MLRSRRGSMPMVITSPMRHARSISISTRRSLALARVSTIRVLKLPGRINSCWGSSTIAALSRRYRLFDPRLWDGGGTTEDEWLPSSVFRRPSSLDQICGSLHLRQYWKRDPQSPVQSSPPFFPGTGLAVGAREDAGDLAEHKGAHGLGRRAAR